MSRFKTTKTLGAIILSKRKVSFILFKFRRLSEIGEFNLELKEHFEKNVYFNFVEFTHFLINFTIRETTHLPWLQESE